MNLEERLRERIRREGPISFYEWMKAALYDEREGYYCTDRVRQGRAGDYRTAPETSPLFAATFANYFAKLFDELGSPERFTIVEAGAGPGEFAHGVLTTLRSEHPRVFSATSYAIEEISEGSRARWAGRLAEFSDRVRVKQSPFPSPLSAEGTRVGVPTPATSPPTPLRAAQRGDQRQASASDNDHRQASDTITGIVFSNELIDAFPVNRVVMRNGRLRQLYIGLNQDAFVWIEDGIEKSVADYFQRIGLKLAEGQIFEINLDAEAFIYRAADLLDCGYIITVDYGAERDEILKSPDRQLGTLRSFRRHQFANDTLAKPGQQDLTTTVDWTQLKEAGERAGLRTLRFERLDEFLRIEGLFDRLAAGTRSATDSAEAIRLTTRAREMILPTGMAASFQVLVQEKSYDLTQRSATS